MEMAPPRDASKTGGRLGGEDMQRYMSDFADKFLEGKILYGKNVVQIKRVISEQQPWVITVRNLDEAVEVYRFDKVVLCSGVCFIPIESSSSSDPMCLGLQHSTLSCGALSGTCSYSRIQGPSCSFYALRATYRSTFILYQKN